MHKILALTIDGYGKVAAPGGVPTGGLNDKGKEIIQNSITIFLVFTIIFALVMFIWGGILWIMSQGDKAKLQAARNRILFAIVGLIVALLSFFIISLVGATFGVQLLGDGSYYYPTCNRGQDC